MERSLKRYNSKTRLYPTILPILFLISTTSSITPTIAYMVVPMFNRVLYRALFRVLLWVLSGRFLFRVLSRRLLLNVWFSGSSLGSLLCEKCPNTEFFLVRIFLHLNWIRNGDLLRKSPHSVRIRENTDHKKLRIWTLFKECLSPRFPLNRVPSIATTTWGFLH